MLQKVMCGFTTPISKFKSNPKAAMAEAKGDAIAISSNNEIQFYAVPAALFEDMTAFCEYAQRGTTKLDSVPGRFSLDDDIDPGQFVEKLATSIQNKPGDDEFIEC
jgi:antitoxin StbD